jgi:hypothetical protein
VIQAATEKSLLDQLCPPSYAADPAPKPALSEAEVTAQGSHHELAIHGELNKKWEGNRPSLFSPSTGLIWLSQL